MTRTAVPRDPACSRGANGANPGGGSPEPPSAGGEGKGGRGVSRRRRALSEDSARTGPPDTGRDPPLPRKRRAPPKGSARTDLPRHSRGTGGAAATRRRGAALRQKARRALTLKPKSGLPPAAAQCRSPSQQSESLPPRKPRTPGAADAAAPKPARGEGPGRDSPHPRGAALRPKTRRAQALQTRTGTLPCRGSAALRQKARRAQTFRETARGTRDRKRPPAEAPRSANRLGAHRPSNRKKGGTRDRGGRQHPPTLQRAATRPAQPPPPRTLGPTGSRSHTSMGSKGGCPCSVTVSAGSRDAASASSRATERTAHHRRVSARATD